MKKYVIIILIAFHLMGGSVYATKTLTFIESQHVHSHSHHGSNHQHKHSHTQTNINFTDFFTYAQNVNTFDFSSHAQTYFETVSWIPDPTLESLFRPPKI